MSTCLACDNVLTTSEAMRKYSNHEEIKKPSNKYICLCNKCYNGAQFEEQLEAYVREDFAGVDNVFMLDSYREE